VWRGVSGVDYRHGVQQARWRGALAVAAAIGLGLSRAHAADGQVAAEAGAAHIAGDSRCPTPADVWTALQGLVPAPRLGLTGDGRPTVLDEGSAYRVLLGERARAYHDPARDCAERARVAAIFLALALEPADAARPEPEAAVAPPAADRPARSLTLLEISARGDAGLAAGRKEGEGGLSVRVAHGGALQWAAGTSVTWPRDTLVGGVRLNQWRLPFDLGLRAQRDAGTLAPFVEGGLMAALVSARAPDLASPRAARAFEWGVRAALGVRGRWWPRLSPLAALHAEWIPRPSAIVALPRGDLGHTPWLWLGASAGLSWGLP
jgi:hypothetical protein